MNNKFTLQELEWHAWLPVLDIAQATPEQLAILESSNSKALTSDYYRLLIVAPQLLQQRSIAFNDIMYGKDGAPYAERELAAVTASKINGCPYCASVHANRFTQHTHREDVIKQVLFSDESTQATVNQRENAIIEFSEKLTHSPDLITAKDIKTLIECGLTLAEVMDILHAAALFSWANRLMLSLGQSQAVCFFE